MFDNATIAPEVDGLIFCKHLVAANLAVPFKGLLPRTRIQKFLAKHPDNEALAKRAWKGFDLFNAGSVRRLEDGSALVNGSACNEYHVHDKMCECPDWQNGYTAYIQAQQEAGTLPPPPVE